MSRNSANSGSDSSSASSSSNSVPTSSSSSVSSASAAPSSSSQPPSSSHPLTLPPEFKLIDNGRYAMVSYSEEGKPDWDGLAAYADALAVHAESNNNAPTPNTSGGQPPALSLGQYKRTDESNHHQKVAYLHAYSQNGQYQVFAMPTDNFREQCQLARFTFALQAEEKKDCQVTLYQPTANDNKLSMHKLVSRFFPPPPNKKLMVTNVWREPRDHVTVKNAKNRTYYAFFTPLKPYNHKLQINCPILADAHDSISALTQTLDSMNMAQPVLVTHESVMTDNMAALALLHGDSTRTGPR